MQILTISGSSREDSSNTQFLKGLPAWLPAIEFQYYSLLHKLPLFHADADKHPWDAEVLDFRKQVATADALLISTPEYIYNLPAILKNALEWLTSSGELYHKPVLAITFTPNPPRGEKAMQSLLWSLQALEARVVAQLPLYQNEIVFDEGGWKAKEEVMEVLREGILLLGNEELKIKNEKYTRR